MMNRFTLDQIPAKDFFCDENVLEHNRALPGSGMARNPNDHVPRLLLTVRPSNCCSIPKTLLSHYMSPTSAAWYVRRRTHFSIGTHS